MHYFIIKLKNLRVLELRPQTPLPVAAEGFIPEAQILFHKVLLLYLSSKTFSFLPLQQTFAGNNVMLLITIDYIDSSK